MKWLWFILVAYALFLAPGQGGLQDPVLKSLLAGNYKELDPLIMMVFSFLGIFPIVWSGLYLRQDHYSVPAWPFALLSFGLGAFSLLPYLFFKGKDRKKRSNVRRAGRILLSNLVILPLLLATLSLYVYGLFQGRFSAYQEAFMQSKLVSVKTADFIVLVIYSYWWMKREKPGSEKWCLFPLAGLHIAILQSKRSHHSGIEDKS
ncbi:hypothetical protein [Metabacillus sp. FJAT-52054]|uniref:DUF2834 domain-containing protein n=1 Tax=Metabacillus sediminis TaxID=3117746 RepID=A0ABZ2NM55_9BACI